MGCGCGGGCGDAGPCSNPCPTEPRSVAFTQGTPQQYASSLARLLEGPADKLRNIFTLVGMRPYVVRLVRTRWTGGARGHGPEVIVDDNVQILPTPLLVDLSGLQRVISPVGADERGSLMLTEISGCYTEEQLRGLSDDGKEIPPDIGFFYEVEFLRPDGKEGERRRFSIAGPPEYVPDEFGWRVRLERAHANRTRAGHPPPR